MSQVVKAIAATDTGNRRVHDIKFPEVFTDVFQSKAEWHEVRDSDRIATKVYRIGVTLGAQAHVSELDQLGSLSAAVDRTKNHVIEAIFGEFRADFRRIEKALYDFDHVTARQLLHEMEDRMYSTK